MSLTTMNWKRALVAWLGAGLIALPVAAISLVVPLWLTYALGAGAVAAYALITLPWVFFDAHRFVMTWHLHYANASFTATQLQQTVERVPGANPHRLYVVEPGPFRLFYRVVKITPAGGLPA